MRLRWIVAGALGVLVVSGGVIANRWLNQPSVVTHVESATTSTPAPTIPEVNLASSYFIASVPSNLTVRTHNDSPVRALERYVLASASPEGDQLAITISKTPVGGLPEVADVALRIRNPSLYAKESLSYLPDKALAFSHEQDTFEEAVFLNGQDRYASIVVTGRADRAGILRELLRSTVTSWQWK
jgi:hypothetical protein